MKRSIFPLAILLFSTLLLLNALIEYRSVYMQEDNLLSSFAPDKPWPKPTASTAPQEDETPQPEVELPDNPIDFAALQEQYPEVVAWIQIPNTNINYAVMQSGTDTPEDFYLSHNEAGEKKKYGSIYIQKYNHADFSDPNTILYGHNMASGSMFANVHKFKKKAFFEENEYLYIYRPGHVLTYRIYSVFTHNSRHLLWAYDFETEEGFQTYIDKTLNPKTSTKQVREGVTPTTADRLVTLSTCVDGSSTSSTRLLLVAVLVEDTPTK